MKEATGDVDTGETAAGDRAGDRRLLVRMPENQMRAAKIWAESQKSGIDSMRQVSLRMCYTVHSD